MIIIKANDAILKWSRKRFFAGVTFSVIMTIFSCAREGSGILGSSTSFSTKIDSATAQAPFAYDIVPDTISYNSCTPYSATGDASTLKSFKIGANQGFTDQTGGGLVQGGLKVKTDFLQYVGKKFGPATGRSTIAPSQVLDVLTKSPVNSSAYLQFSVRKKNDLTIRPDLLNAAANPTLSLATPGRDAAVFATSLSAGLTGKLLTNDIVYTTSGTVLVEGRRIYSISDSNSAFPIEGSLAYNKTADESYPPATNADFAESFLGVAEYYSYKIREEFNTSDSKSKLLLTATFGGINQEGITLNPQAGTSMSTIAQLIRPSNSSSLAYGRGYELTFSAPKSTSGSATLAAGWIKTNLTAVKEIDLSTGSTVSASWTCESFVVTLASQWDNKNLFEPTCAPLLQSDELTRSETLKRIRRHYNEREWNVGLFFPKNIEPTVSRSKLGICLSPKISVSCYLPTDPNSLFNQAEKDQIGAANLSDIGITYDTSKECYMTAYTYVGVSYSTAQNNIDKKKLGRCANYVSICTRKDIN